MSHLNIFPEAGVFGTTESALVMACFSKAMFTVECEGLRTGRKDENDERLLSQLGEDYQGQRLQRMGALREKVRDA